MVMVEEKEGERAHSSSDLTLEEYSCASGLKAMVEDVEGSYRYPVEHAGHAKN